MSSLLPQPSLTDNYSNFGIDTFLESIEKVDLPCFEENNNVKPSIKLQNDGTKSLIKPSERLKIFKNIVKSQKT